MIKTLRLGGLGYGGAESRRPGPMEESDDEDLDMYLAGHRCRLYVESWRSLVIAIELYTARMLY